MPSESPLALLAQAETYLAQIESLRRRRGRLGRLDSLRYRGLSLGDLGVDSRSLAERLARSVADGTFRFSPVVIYVARVNGKERPIYRSNLVDTIVLGALGHVLIRLCDRVLSDRVYSYRPERSSWQVLSDLRAYFQEHRRTRPDRRHRALYVLHRDIKRYSETIPTHAGSQLWVELERVFDLDDVVEGHPVRKLARDAMRPEADASLGLPAPEVGVPTGSQAQTIACNLYLSEVDRRVAPVPGAFYARFGDDMLFCHPDGAVAERVAREIDEIVTGLGLAVKAEKKRDLYLTRPGRPSEAWPRFKGTSSFDYLGYRIDAAGNIALKGEKAHRLLGELRARAQSAFVLARDELGSSADDAVARVVCGAVARALDPDATVSDPTAGMLRYIVTDRGHLAQLDHTIALMVAETLSRRRGPRAFRRFPPRRLRDLGLPSLVVARNAPRGADRGPA